MLDAIANHWFFQKLTDPLVLFGMAGQVTFMMRFVVQWIASERRGRSYVPIAFWYLSLVGGLMLFVYAWNNHDPVIMLGQSLGLGIYARNLYLIHVRQSRYGARRAAGGRRGPAAGKAEAARPSAGSPSS